MTVSSAAPPPVSAIPVRGGIWGRQLDRYPSHGPRALYLGIVVLATITLYYELYVQGSVATQLAASLHMTLVYLISISIVGNAVGALASVVAGLADRWGRANLVVYGLALTGALVLFGLAGAHSKALYLVMFAAVSFVEGIILVATPALIRDFSPQLGRASAMGFWTLGPVVGSLVVSEVASHTLVRHPDWQYQFRVCGVVGLVVFVLAFLGLRELAPQLRDQLMVSLRDRTLIEARARGIDPEQAVAGHWRQMLRLDIIGPAFAISVYLLFYYIAVGLFVVFFATTFGYSEDRANALANWYWGFQCIALVLTGLLSDWLRVRKPFMVLGGVISSVGIALFAIATTHPATTYYHFVVIILLISIGSAIAFASWMAGFTETVESHNPAATATGLAVWGSTLRTVVVVALIGLIAVIPAASTLVDQGSEVAAAAAGATPILTADENAAVKAVAADPTIVTRVQAIASQDSAQLATAQQLTAQTQVALAANPNDAAAQVQALSEISGLTAAQVTQVLTLGTQDQTQLATAQAIDTSTQAALQANPNDTAAQAKAVGDIATAFHISAAAATARFQALALVPTADLALLATDAKPVQTAATQLKALAAVPAADLALVQKYGGALQDAKVLAELQYLQTEGPIVAQAQKDDPGQWQTWWWICFAGGVLFLPFVWLLKGRWSPAKAREDAAAHHDAVRRELKALRQAAASGE
ncbi:MFS transporter [Actinospica durhamensis]|uniref:MFS transporter n=1 Tax=Actinospica durhamensis TaxID=1508375 RepID=A0A941EWT8_9ACTN|nr:MFS transporter [Actinospica durhamensis]MBR7835399.1 MFS transporter [Actinospica durhamensis]